MCACACMHVYRRMMQVQSCVCAIGKCSETLKIRHELGLWWRFSIGYGSLYH